VRLATPLLFLACLPAAAQTAKVVALSPEDIAQAKELAHESAEYERKAHDFREHIMRDYLVTTDRGKGASTWNDPNDAAPAGAVWASNGMFYVNGIAGIGGGDPHCMTPEEKAKAAAERKKIEDEQAAYEKAHPTKYIRYGWDNPGSFQFSDDFRYIVPAPAPDPAEKWPHDSWGSLQATQVGK